MKHHLVNCSYCKKTFFRSARQINEANKFEWRQFCSKECHSKAKNKQKDLQCSNPQCKNIFKRKVYKNTIEAYCSRSCAAKMNNKKFPKRHAVRKYCAFCNKEFISREKYCSVICRIKGQEITKEVIYREIQEFYKTNERIPFKKEFIHSRAARERYGTWNKAIEAAGFSPNPVKFAKKYIAKDGHKCDSLAEKIIDDWLSTRKVHHNKSVFYPGNLRFSADFVVGNYWIEFFGLAGQHKRYDELKEVKLKLAKEYGLKIIEIYPKDLFPENKLDQILKFS